MKREITWVTDRQVKEGKQTNPISHTHDNVHTKVKQARAKLHERICYKIHPLSVKFSRENAQQLNTWPLSGFEKAYVLSFGTELLSVFSLADSIREQGGQTRKTESKSSRGGRCVILPPLSGIKCPASDVRHGPLIKRPPDARDHCLKRATRAKSPDNKHCHGSLTLLLVQNAVQPLRRWYLRLSKCQRSYKLITCSQFYTYLLLRISSEVVICVAFKLLLLS